MNTFPAAAWTPTADEYFSATAPDGTDLHGSSKLKRFMFSPRIFGETLAAQMARRVAMTNGGGGRLRSVPTAMLEALEPKPWMLFGSAVESFAFPFTGDFGPELPAHQTIAARTRAEQIRQHPEAGKYIAAPGAVYQIAHRWQDPASGIWLRARWDCGYWAISGPAVLDLKIWTGCNEERRIRFKVRDNGADIQGAIYRRGAMDLWGASPPHSLLIAGPSVTDRIYVRTLSPKLLAEADDKISAALDGLAECYRTGRFEDPEEKRKEVL